MSREVEEELSADMLSDVAKLVRSKGRLKVEVGKLRDGYPS